MQYIGLVSSFVGTSICQLLSISSKYIILKVKGRKLRNCVVALKWFLYFIVLLFCGLQVYTILLNLFFPFYYYPKTTTVNVMKLEIINMVICVPVGYILKSSKEIIISYLIRYENMTISKIEKATNRGLDDVLVGVYWGEQSRPIPLEWIVTPKVLFRVDRFMLSRCFQLIIDPAESKYRKPFSSPELRIKSKHENYSLFLLTDTEKQFNFKSFELREGYGFRKTIRRYSTDTRNCIRYNEKYFNCSNENECLEKCIQRRFLDTYRNISSWHPSVIDKDQFSGSEWNKSYLIKKDSLNISRECDRKFWHLPICIKVEFEKTGVRNKQPDENDENLLKIDLNYEVFSRWKRESSKYQLMLELMNIQSVLLGLTVLNQLKTIYSFIQNKLKPSGNKISLFFIYLLCTVGFSWHTYYMVELLLGEDLIYIENYEIVENFRMPHIVFCHRIDNPINKNHKLSGNYLETLTGNLNTSSMFKSITYRNGSNDDWNSLNLSSVKTFFITNKKCFTIDIDKNYEIMRKKLSNSTDLSTSTEILRVNYGRMFFNDTNKLTFMTGAKNGTEFSKIKNLKALKSLRLDNFGYSVSQELFLIRYETKFSSIKKTLSPWYETDPNDLSDYLDELINNKYDLKSLYLPLRASEFNSNIDDQLFEQYFYKTQSKISQTITRNSSFYKKELAINHYQEKKQEWDFTFKLSYFKKITLIYDEDTNTNLVLNILTIISFWLNFALFDLCFHSNRLFPIIPMFHKLQKLFYFFMYSISRIKLTPARKSLLKFKAWLSKRLCIRRYPDLRRRRLPIVYRNAVGVESLIK